MNAGEKGTDSSIIFNDKTHKSYIAVIIKFSHILNIVNVLPSSLSVICPSHVFGYCSFITHLALYAFQIHLPGNECLSSSAVQTKKSMCAFQPTAALYLWKEGQFLLSAAPAKDCARCRRNTNNQSNNGHCSLSGNGANAEEKRVALQMADSFIEQMNYPKMKTQVLTLSKQ